MPISSKKLREKAATEKTEAKKPIIYNKIETRVYATGVLGPMQADQAKTYLGWEEEGKEQFGKKFFMTYKGKKIRLKNNNDNRFFYEGHKNLLKQEILRGRWNFNGEPVVISETGQVHDGQHTLIAFIEAVDDWIEDKERWPFWQQEPRLEKLVVLGISDDNHVVNTLNTGKRRSDTDVFGRLPYFRKLPNSDRKQCSKSISWAIRTLWKRTGVHTDAFSVKRTPAESVSYIEKHPRLIDAVLHIYNENGEDKISRWLAPGYAAAALYLMATDESDPSIYYKDEDPREDLLDFSKWKRACEFFVELPEGKSLSAVRQEIKKLMSEETRVTWEERMSAIAGAWVAYRLGKPVTAKHVEVAYDLNEYGQRVLIDHTLFGGIDVGDELSFATNGDPSKKEIEETKKKIKEKRFPPSKKVAKRAGDEWAKGDRAWVHDPGLASDNGAYFCELAEEPYECDDGKWRVSIDDLDEGGTFTVEVDQLSFKQFELSQTK